MGRLRCLLSHFGAKFLLMNKRRRRRGFSLAEIAVAVALVAILAAVVIPSAYGSLRDASIRRKASTLSMLAQAIMTYHDHVGMWPKTLVELTTKPVAGTDQNICSTAMANKDVARWYGPYVGTPISATGLILDDDTVRAALGYPTTTNLQIKMEFPTADTRQQIGLLLDGDTSSTAGIIQSSGSQLTYNLPIVGC